MDVILTLRTPPTSSPSSPRNTTYKFTGRLKSRKISIILYIYIHHYIMLPSLHMKYQPTVGWKWIYVTGELSGIIGKKCSMLQKI